VKAKRFQMDEPAWCRLPAYSVSALAKPRDCGRNGNRARRRAEFRPEIGKVFPYSLYDESLPTFLFYCATCEHLGEHAVDLFRHVRSVGELNLATQGSRCSWPIPHARLLIPASACDPFGQTR